MSTLDIAQKHVNLTRSGTRYVGACPKCGGSAKSTRFFVNVDKNDCHCFACDLHGDEITLLRELEGFNCPDAHEAIGRECHNRDCPAWENCRMGARASGEGVKKQQRKSLEVPLPEETPQFVPVAATSPQQLWQQQAATLIKKAHAKLLETPEQLDYLAKRGLPLDAVTQYQLGWMPADRYPSRAAWGLPEKLREDKKPKKLFIPSGVLIPFFDDSLNPHRIRIRRNEIREQDGRYYWLSGSGDDVPVIGTEARAFVVVESDLDALMTRYQSENIVGTIPLGSCGTKPKQWALEALKKALAILIALDIEPRINPLTEKHENPGGEASKWWQQQFPRATRWPVPAGKDPGEYYQDHGGNIKAWVLAGLPPAFHVPPAVKKPAPKIPEHIKGQTINGHHYVVAHHAAAVDQLKEHYPDAVVLSPAELAACKGMSQVEAETVLLGKKVFAGTIRETKPLEPGQYQDLHPPLPDDPAGLQGELVY